MPVVDMMPNDNMEAMQTIFVVGPTAVGKSAVALELARMFGGEILSADSMQVYRGMDIGTAKATSEERKAVRHHLLDVCEVTEAFDVKRYVTLAQSLITSLPSPLIICGGTGLYVRALRRGLFEGPARNPKLRERLEKMSATELFEELQQVDPLTSSRIDRHNPRRLVRALEVFHETGKAIAELQKEWGSEEREVKIGERTDVSICLNRDRDDLHARIERRIDAQIAAGWVEEVRRLLTRGLDKNPTAMQAAGYRELVAHVRGELSLDEAVALIKTRTRQLAKRQLTWFRREPQLDWDRAR
jgi:tRNA dimethylallyltransferase